MLNFNRCSVNIITKISICYFIAICLNIHLKASMEFNNIAYVLIQKCYYTDLNQNNTKTQSSLACCSLCNIDTNCNVCGFCKNMDGSSNLICRTLNSYDINTDPQCLLTVNDWMCRYYERVRINYKKK